MIDVVDSGKRSAMMSRIRQKDTSPEWLVRRYLHARGFRYTLHRKDLAGTPDIVLPRHHAVVFVHGCFWHAHQGCRFAVTPSTRRDFWIAKFESNRTRDELAVRRLQGEGWRVVVVWECALRSSRKEVLSKLEKFVTSTAPYAELG